jgi:uncharacterized caspase-like protein
MDEILGLSAMKIALLCVAVLLTALVPANQRDGSTESIRLYVESGVHHSARGIAFSEDGQFVATGSLDRTIKLWDLRSSRELMTIPNNSMATFIVFLHDQPIIAASSENGTVDLWNFQKAQLIVSLKCSQSMNPSIALADSGKTLLCADERNNLIHRWDTGTFAEGKSQFIQTPVRTTDWRLSTDGELLAVNYESGASKILSSATSQVVGDFKTVSSFYGVCFTKRSDRFAVADEKGVHVLHWSDGVGSVAREEKMIPLANVHSLMFSDDGRFLGSATEAGDIVIVDTRDWTEAARLKSYSNRIENAGIAPQSSVLAVQVWYNSHFAWDLKKGSLVSNSSAVLSYDNSNSFPAAGSVFGHAFTVNNQKDFLRLETEQGLEICSLVLLDKQGAWVIVAPDGRFDTNMDLSNVEGVHWILSGNPFRPLPLEIFMRDYYEPRLLPELLARKDMPKLPSLTELNRVQPEVKILAIRRGSSADETLVEVQALGKEDKSQPSGKTKTEVYDLRLFRNGQLVGQWPVPEHGMAGPKDTKLWREVSVVPTPIHVFPVRLAAKDRGEPVTFTAYAFNEDRVKSETTPPVSYTEPLDVPARKAKAYVITVGANGYENSKRNLEFAVKDAESMASALRQIKDYEVVPVSLVSEAPIAHGSLNQATKANVRAVLGVLAGKPPSKVLSGVANTDKLAKATPDDLVILSFSGHGYTKHDNAFYLLPSDSGAEDAITTDSLKKFISSEELSEWLREVDAGQMAMIIDACHSAASVDSGGFKPGPMGDRGLGQLAYDKGMRILAASQADDVALEIQNLHHGLLTYALVVDGLKAGEGGKLAADLNGDGQVTLEEWLKYGEQRTPSLYEDVKGGKIKMVSRDSTVNPAFIDETTKRAQTPALFDFQKQNDNVVLQTKYAASTSYIREEERVGRFVY